MGSVVSLGVAEAVLSSGEEELCAAVKGLDDENRQKLIVALGSPSEANHTSEKFPVQTKQQQEEEASTAASATSQGGEEAVPKPGPVIELFYFNVCVMGEPARAVCALGDFEWKDNRIRGKEYGELGWRSLKPETKWGTVPMLKVGDKQINQSMAIIRYLGKLVKVEGKSLYPEDALEAGLVDDVCEFLFDVDRIFDKTRCGFGADRLPDGELEPARVAIMAPTGAVGNAFCQMEANAGKFAAGNDCMSIADICIFRYVYMALSGHVAGLTGRFDLFEPWPKIKAICERVKALPKIKEYYTKMAAENPIYKVFAGL